MHRKYSYLGQTERLRILGKYKYMNMEIRNTKIELAGNSALNGIASTLPPASAKQKHHDCPICLDTDSASLLSNKSS